jgi:FAD/FMN-containing dehydrogenase
MVRQEWSGVPSDGLSDSSLGVGVVGWKGMGVVGWKGIGVKYGKLHDFFGGLAAVFPGAQLVESDFSFLKMNTGKHSAPPTYRPD